MNNFYHNGGQIFKMILTYIDNNTNHCLILGKGTEKAYKTQRKKHIELMDNYYYSKNQYHVFYGNRNDPKEGYGFTKLSHRKSRNPIGEQKALEIFFQMIKDQKFISFKKLKNNGSGTDN